MTAYHYFSSANVPASDHRICILFSLFSLEHGLFDEGFIIDRGMDCFVDICIRLSLARITRQLELKIKPKGKVLHLLVFVLFEFHSEVEAHECTF